MYFGQNKVGIAAHAHVAPCLGIVVVLAQHQFQAFFGKLVVHSHRLVGRGVHGVGESVLELYKSDDAIVDECNELRANTLANKRSARYFERANALGLDEELVGERRRAQYAPRCPIVVQFLAE